MALFKKTEKYTYENKRKENQAQRLVYKKKWTTTGSQAGDLFILSLILAFQQNFKAS